MSRYTVAKAHDDELGEISYALSAAWKNRCDIWPIFDTEAEDSEPVAFCIGSEGAVGLCAALNAAEATEVAEAEVVASGSRYEGD